MILTDRKLTEATKRYREHLLHGIADALVRQPKIDSSPERRSARGGQAQTQTTAPPTRNVGDHSVRPDHQALTEKRVLTRT